MLLELLWLEDQHRTDIEDCVGWDVAGCEDAAALVAISLVRFIGSSTVSQSHIINVTRPLTSERGFFMVSTHLLQY